MGALDSNLDEELGKVYDHAVVTRLISYLGPHKKRMFLAFLCTIVYSIANSAGPRLA